MSTLTRSDGGGHTKYFSFEINERNKKSNNVSGTDTLTHYRHTDTLDTTDTLGNTDNYRHSRTKVTDLLLLVRSCISVLYTDRVVRQKTTVDTLRISDM